MSKFRSPRNSKSPKRANTAGSIRGTISGPIPIQDDEFPMRSPGTGIATPLGTEGIDKQLQAQLRGSGVPRPDSGNLLDRSVRADSEIPEEQPSNISQPSYDSVQQRGPSPQSTIPQRSVTSVPAAFSEGKPQRKKSNLRSVFNKLFKSKKTKGAGAQGASEVRAGQHRSVSDIFCATSASCMANGFKGSHCTK